MRYIEKKGFVFYFECVTKFYSTVVIKGLVHAAGGGEFQINAIQMEGNSISFQTVKIEAADNNNKLCSYRFLLEANTTTDDICINTNLIFSAPGIQASITIEEMIDAVEYLNSSISHEFFNYVKSSGSINLLDIGGRARSGLLRSAEFINAKTTVLDIIEGDGVDVIADAHDLTSHLPKNFFDACMCISVFEHLIMPWKVVIEVNKILKPGGLFFVATHQTIGMHDIPWDYFRFSDSSWDGLFNKHTGFEIVNRNMSGLNYIIPFAWSRDKNFSERAAGYESSVVLARKIANTKLKWPVSASDLTASIYPE